MSLASSDIPGGNQGLKVSLDTSNAPLSAGHDPVALNHDQHPDVSNLAQSLELANLEPYDPRVDTASGMYPYVQHAIPPYFHPPLEFPRFTEHADQFHPSLVSFHSHNFPPPYPFPHHHTSNPVLIHQDTRALPPSSSHGSHTNKSQQHRSIWVGNISDKSTRDDLIHYFGQFHGFLDLYYMKQTRSAFVNMATNEAVEEAALQFHGQLFKGSRLICRSRLNKTASSTPDNPINLPAQYQPQYHQPAHFHQHASPGPYLLMPTSMPYVIPNASAPYPVPGNAPVHMFVSPGHAPNTLVPVLPSQYTGGQVGGLVSEVAPPGAYQVYSDPHLTAPRLVFHPCGIGWIPVKDFIEGAELASPSGLVAPSPSGVSIVGGGGPMVASPSNRYFIIKALSLEDLELSMKHGIWSPQVRIMHWLDLAFKASEIVYLIFSVNKSGEYFGFARMTSAIGKEAVPALKWSIQGSSRRTALGGIFGVKWQIIQRLPFTHVRHISNQWNNNKEVKVSRDGTELEPTAGHQLLMEFYRFKHAEESLVVQGLAPQYPLPVRFSYYTL